MSDQPFAPNADGADARPDARPDTAPDVAAAFTEAEARMAPAGRSCRRCGEAFEAGTGRCPRCQCFAPGNQAARTLGLRATQQPVELRMTADELMSGIVSDRGGEANLSTLERSYVRKIADVEIVIRLLTSNIASHGLFTNGGRVRDTYDKLLAGLDRFDRLAQRIGLERRAKSVGGLQAAIDAHEGVD